MGHDVSEQERTISNNFAHRAFYIEENGGYKWFTHSVINLLFSLFFFSPLPMMLDLGHTVYYVNVVLLGRISEQLGYFKNIMGFT